MEFSITRGVIEKLEHVSTDISELDKLERGLFFKVSEVKILIFLIFHKAWNYIGLNVSFLHETWAAGYFDNSPCDMVSQKNRMECTLYHITEC